MNHATTTNALVIAYSVFSHLSEKACADRMREFARIVKLGGIVAWTTRNDSFFEFFRWAKTQRADASGYIRALGERFPDIDYAARRYRKGEFIHATSDGVRAAFLATPVSMVRHGSRNSTRALPMLNILPWRRAVSTPRSTTRPAWSFRKNEPKPGWLRRNQIVRVCHVQRT